MTPSSSSGSPSGPFGVGLTLDRIMGEFAQVPLKDEVWPKFLRHNAARVLGLPDEGHHRATPGKDAE